MALFVYLRDTPSTAVLSGRWSAGDNLANAAGVAQGWVGLLAGTSRGAAASTLTRASVAGATSGIEIGADTHWVSAPIDRDVLITGTITINLRMAEGLGTTNAGPQVIIERVDPVGNLTTIVNSEKGTELGTAEALQRWTVTPTSTQLHKGDRIRIRVLANDAGGTMASGDTITLWLNGPTASASGDSYIAFTETFVTQFTTPAGSELFMTNAAGDVDPDGVSYDSKDWSFVQPSGEVTAVLNSVGGGWTAPLLWRVTGNGNFLEWFSPLLGAFTLADLVSVRFRGQESNASANVSPRAEITLCDAAGNAISVWAAATLQTELGTTDASHSIYLAGDDLAVASGQRLRLRLFMDDFESAPVGVGYTATLRYNNSTCEVIFSQTFQEQTFINVAVGMASEQDSGIVVDPDVGHRRRVGIPSESNSAQPLTSRKTITLGQASELDIPQQLRTYGAPSGLVATAIASDEIVLIWDPVFGATSYNIERNGVVIAEYQEGTFYSDTGLTPNTTYSYRVRAVVAVVG